MRGTAVAATSRGNNGCGVVNEVTLEAARVEVGGGRESLKKEKREREEKNNEKKKEKKTHADIKIFIIARKPIRSSVSFVGSLRAARPYLRSTFSPRFRGYLFVARDGNPWYNNARSPSNFVRRVKSKRDRSPRGYKVSTRRRENLISSFIL